MKITAVSNNTNEIIPQIGNTKNLSNLYMSTPNNSTDTFQKSENLQKKSVEFKGRTIKGIYYSNQELFDALHRDSVQLDNVVMDRVGFFRGMFTDVIDVYKAKIFKLKEILENDLELQAQVREEASICDWVARKNGGRALADKTL